MSLFKNLQPVFDGATIRPFRRFAVLSIFIYYQRKIKYTSISTYQLIELSSTFIYHGIYEIGTEIMRDVYKRQVHIPD